MKDFRHGLVHRRCIGWLLMRPAHHDHRQGERARGRDLGVGRRAAAVLGDEDFDVVGGQQRPLVAFGERAAVENVARAGQPVLRCDRVYAAHDVAVSGKGAERCEFLPADGEEYRFRLGPEQGGGLRDIGGVDPAIAFDGKPRRPFEPDQRNAGRPGCRFGVPGNMPGEGMGCVHHHVDGIGGEPVRKPLGPAEAAPAHLASLRQRLLRASGQRQRDAQPVRCRKALGQLARLARAAEDQDMRDYRHAV